MENKAEYNKLRSSAKQDVCEQFLELYPGCSLDKIHKTFQELNPTVQWKEDEKGEYTIWEVWKVRFEKMLAED